MKDYGTIIHRTIDDSYVINNNSYHVPNFGEWVEQWADVHAYAQEHPDRVSQELPPPEPTLEEVNNAAALAIRQERDRRITVTDFRVMPDYPDQSEAWIIYRQALRDLPEQVGFPWQGVDSAPWPDPPDGIPIGGK